MKYQNAEKKISWKEKKKTSLIFLILWNLIYSSKFFNLLFSFKASNFNNAFIIAQNKEEAIDLGKKYIKC